MKKVLIVGTGLIGASVGLALKANGFQGEVAGWDANAEELKKALEIKAIDRALERREDVLETDADVVVLATPVLPILDWMQQLAPKLKETQLVTDVGSTKGEITVLGGKLFNQAREGEVFAGTSDGGERVGGRGAGGGGFVSRSYVAVLPGRGLGS